jgi:hypothetical protein
MMHGTINLKDRWLLNVKICPLENPVILKLVKNFDQNLQNQYVHYRIHKSYHQDLF